MEPMKHVMVDLKNDIHCKNLIRLMDEYMRDEMGTGKPMPVGFDYKLIEGLRHHVGYLGFFACVGNEFAALANCNINFSTWQAKPLLNIHDFLVDPSFRNKGIGLFLLKEIEEYAVDNGFCKITLEVRHDNYKAQRLYQKAGYGDCIPANYFWENKLV